VKKAFSEAKSQSFVIFFTPFLFENAYSGALQRSGHQRKVTVPCASSMRKGVKERGWSQSFVIFFTPLDIQNAHEVGCYE